MSERAAVERREPLSVRVTLNPLDSQELGKMLAANDSDFYWKTTLKSVEGYEVFVELDSIWLRELQKGSALVWIGVPGAVFSTKITRIVGRDLAAVLLGESDISIPLWMTCDVGFDGLREAADGSPELFPVYFVPTEADMAEVLAAKNTSVKKTPVLRRTVPGRSARRRKAARTVTMSTIEVRRPYMGDREN